MRADSLDLKELKEYSNHKHFLKKKNHFMMKFTQITQIKITVSGEEKPWLKNSNNKKTLVNIQTIII